MQFFELVHIADLVSQMIDTHYNDDVKCWIDENDFMSELSTEKKTFERLIDDEVAAGMDKSIQVLINHTDIIMEKELLPTDYNPPGKGVVDIRPTKVNTEIE